MLDENILAMLDIPACMLPEVRNSSEIYGTINLSGCDVPIAGIAGDSRQHSLASAVLTKETLKTPTAPAASC